MSEVANDGEGEITLIQQFHRDIKHTKFKNNQELAVRIQTKQIKGQSIFVTENKVKYQCFFNS